MPFEDDPREYDAPDEEPEEEAPKRRSWTRWLGIGVAAAVLLLGVISLISALSHRSDQEQPADLNALRSTIASEEAELKSLQTEYDTVKQTLEDKQKEYDQARAKLESGVVDSSAEGQQSLDELKAAAEKAQEEYSAALEAYNASIDAIEAATPGYDAAKAELEKLAPLQNYAAAYTQFISGASDTLPGYENEDPDAEGVTQSWYAAVVLPAAQQAGLDLPEDVASFPAAVQALAAEPAAKVKAYDDALAASKEAEDKLKEANTSQEDAAKAYADGKNTQKTSEEWLADCEVEIERLEKRLAELEKSIAEVKADLEAHRAELKKLEGN